ncbi:MAG: hypothetical protein MHPSP_004579, partial [Paramarteilia canceri]
RSISNEFGLNLSDIIISINGSNALDILSNKLVLPNSINNINLSVPVVGGKAHGQLTKAGKVRSATPKVEKKTSKKKALNKRMLCKRAKYRQKFSKLTAAKLNPRNRRR